MPTNRVLIILALIALAGAVWFASSAAPSTVEPSVDTPTRSPPPAARAEVRRPLAPTTQSAQPRPIPPAGALDAGQPLPVRADWRARWQGIPLDEAGRSMTGRGQTKAFNHALHAATREELQRCAAARPQQVEQQVTMELFVEATDTGYNVVGAEAPSDAGLDSYTRRCFELAFEAQLEIADAGTTGGVLYHFAYPMLLPGPPENGDTAPN